MLRNLKSPETYFQTAFRVQSPWEIKDEAGNRQIMKQECYVFDFAPDRTLKVLAEAAKVSHRARSTASESDRVRLGEFLNFCPVIGYHGTSLSKFNVESMLEQLKRAYISRVTRNGCDDPRLYNQEMLRKLVDIQYTRNDPSMSAADAIAQSNRGNYDLHLFEAAKDYYNL